MQISFYKTQLVSQDSKPQPDTYHNVSNVVVYSDGAVLFTHVRNGKEEFVMSNLPYKLIGSKEELDSVMTKGVY